MRASYREVDESLIDFFIVAVIIDSMTALDRQIYHNHTDRYSEIDF